MDPAGAAELKRRIEQQDHWQQASAVRAGRQPRMDPDHSELSELGYGVRLYGTEQRHEVVDGHRSLVTLRICKRIVNGAWRHDVIQEDVKRFG